MDSTASDLESVIDAVAALGIPVPGSQTDAEAARWIALVEQLGRRADALRVAAAGDVDQRSRRELGADSLARKHGLQTAGQLDTKSIRDPYG